LFAAQLCKVFLYTDDHYNELYCTISGIAVIY
jgi:hypothetical protein